MAKLPTGNVTFLFTDIVRSTERWQQFPDAMALAQERHDQILDQIVAFHGGNVFKHVGDEVCAVFEDATAAAKASIEAQRTISATDWTAIDPSFPPLTVRMAIHSGPALRRGNDYHGIELARISRLVRLGGGGQIVVSDTARQGLGAPLGLPAKATLRRLGSCRLGGLSSAEDVYQLLAPGLNVKKVVLPAPDPAELLDSSRDAASSGSTAATLASLLQSVRTQQRITIAADDLRLLREHRPRDLDEYQLLRVAEWTGGRYRLDTRFVHLVLRMQRDAEGMGPDHDRASHEFHDLGATLSALPEPAIVVVGSPGSGKTTLLRRLELDLAIASLRGEGNRIGWTVPLGSYHPGVSSPADWLATRWQNRFPDLEPLGALMASGRVVFLLDGLNEMQHRDQAEYFAQMAQWRRWLEDELAPRTGNRAVLTCRSQDYTSSLSSGSLAVPLLFVDPLTDAQVRDFLRANCPWEADEVWAAVAGSPMLELLRQPYNLTLLTEQVEVDGQVSEGQVALFTGFVRRAIEREVLRANPRFLSDALLSSRDRRGLVQGAFARAPLALPTDGALEPGLCRLADGLQRTGWAEDVAAVRVAQDTALSVIGPPVAGEVLGAGFDLGVLEDDLISGEIMFRHQLLQEYFAARLQARQPDPALARSTWRRDDIVPALDATVAALAATDPLPPPPATGWEETMVMAAALMPRPDAFVAELAEQNLVLAARCAAQPDVALAPEFADKLRWRLVERSRSPAADLRSRIAAGLALGALGDPRFESQLSEAGRFLKPPMVPIPGGRYPIGTNAAVFDEESPEHVLELPSFCIGQYAVTNAEWRCFIEAGGYEDERWWSTEDAAAWRRGEGTAEGLRENARLTWYRFRSHPDALDDLLDRGEVSHEWFDRWRLRLTFSPEEFEEHLRSMYPDQPLRAPRYWNVSTMNQALQPVAGISWYEALAYCAWLSACSGLTFRLPTEVEWEAAARGPEGRMYSFGEPFDPSRCNTLETHVRSTTPIGVFPDGDTPDGLADMAGNVMTWTQSLYDDSDARQFAYPYRPDDGREDLLAPRTIFRVARGGAWGFDATYARATCRYYELPGAQLDVVGLRLVAIPR